MQNKFLFYLLALILFGYSNTSLGQTKKIALRSHSGNHSNFNIYAPDEFGMVPPSRMREYYRPINIETLHARDLSIQDTLTSCKPIPDSIYYPKVNPIRPRKNIQKQQKPLSDTSMIRAATPPIEEVPSIVVNAIPPKPQKGSMNWIGILILLPIAFVFRNSIKA